MLYQSRCVSPTASRRIKYLQWEVDIYSWSCSYSRSRPLPGWSMENWYKEDGLRRRGKNINFYIKYIHYILYILKIYKYILFIFWIRTWKALGRERPTWFEALTICLWPSLSPGIWAKKYCYLRNLFKMQVTFDCFSHGKDTSSVCKDNSRKNKAYPKCAHNLTFTVTKICWNLQYSKQAQLSEQVRLNLARVKWVLFICFT